MSVRDWQRVIDDVATVGARSIQFIGGEPTTHPSFVQLVEHASLTGLEVEIFSNLLDIRPEWWDLFSRCGVTLATSYYSDQSAEHEEITRRRGSYQRTRANIAEAISRQIPPYELELSPCIRSSVLMTPGARWRHLALLASPLIVCGGLGVVLSATQ
jgi:MoaA/NifB/PqqE/SkfB family radical SAM enzyme